MIITLTLTVSGLVGRCHDRALVELDNRRPLDFDALLALLEMNAAGLEDGVPSRLVKVSCALEVRQDLDFFDIAAVAVSDDLVAPVLSGEVAVGRRWDFQHA